MQICITSNWQDLPIRFHKTYTSDLDVIRENRQEHNLRGGGGRAKMPILTLQANVYVLQPHVPCTKKQLEGLFGNCSFTSDLCTISWVWDQEETGVTIL